MSAQPLAPDYDLARRVAEILAPLPQLEAVYLGGAGTDWLRAPAYPYALVQPASADQSRGEVSRSVRVLLALRAPDYAQKPAPDPATQKLYTVGAGAELSALVAAATDALVAAAETGAPISSISTAYDTEPQAPVETAELTVALDDAQAFGDAL